MLLCPNAMPLAGDDNVPSQFGSKFKSPVAIEKWSFIASSLLYYPFALAKDIKNIIGNYLYEWMIIIQQGKPLLFDCATEQTLPFSIDGILLKNIHFYQHGLYLLAAGTLDTESGPDCDKEILCIQLITVDLGTLRGRASCPRRIHDPSSISLDFSQWKDVFCACFGPLLLTGYDNNKEVLSFVIFVPNYNFFMDIAIFDVSDLMSSTIDALEPISMISTRLHFSPTSDGDVLDHPRPCLFNGRVCIQSLYSTRTFKKIPQTNKLFAWRLRATKYTQDYNFESDSMTLPGLSRLFLVNSSRELIPHPTQIIPHHNITADDLKGLMDSDEYYLNTLRGAAHSKIPHRLYKTFAIGVIYNIDGHGDLWSISIGHDHVFLFSHADKNHLTIPLAGVKESNLLFFCRYNALVIIYQRIQITYRYAASRRSPMELTQSEFSSFVNLNIGTAITYF